VQTPTWGIVERHLITAKFRLPFPQVSTDVSVNKCKCGCSALSESRYNFAMQEKRERWMQLAELASVEQDPEKLSELVREITHLLDEKQARLNAARIPSKPSE
jgi:hypothetical protein